MLGWLRRLFAGEPDDEDFIRSVREHNMRERPAFERLVNVVTYAYVDERDIPDMRRVCEFHGDHLPEPGSVLYAPDDRHEYLVRYRVRGIDHLEDEEGGVPTRHITLIVVEPMDV